MHGARQRLHRLRPARRCALPSSEQWRALSDRHTGIGFDQALVLLPPRRGGTDTFYRVFNADGGEVEQCGNGVRCIAALLHRARSRATAKTLVIDSLGGLAACACCSTAAMSPSTWACRTSIRDRCRSMRRRRRDAIGSIPAARRIEISAVSIGNPHAVLRVDVGRDAPRWSASGARCSRARISATGQRRLHAGARSRPHPPARIRARRRRDAGLRHRRMRRRGRRPSARSARCRRRGACARRRVERTLGVERAQSVWLTGPGAAQLSKDCVDI